MIVPFAKGQQAAPPQAKPSETAMLMAIAQMHARGAFVPKPDAPEPEAK